MVTISHAQTRRAWRYAAAALILLLAATARILHLNAQALWIDEGATYSILRLPDLGAMIAQIAQRDHHPPLYFALLKGWSLVAGDSVLSLRLFSALPSLLSVAAVFALARRLNRAPGRAWFNAAGVGLLAMLMLALSDPEFVLAQDIRMYALRTFLCILHVLAYVAWLQTGSRRWAAGWVVVGVLLLHTQYQGLYLLAVEGLHALLFLRGRQRWNAVGLLVLQGILFAPWFLTVGWQQRNNDPGIWGSRPTNWQTVIELRDKYLGQMWPLMAALLCLGTFALIPTVLNRVSSTVRVRWRVQARPFGIPFLLVTWIAFTVVVTFVLNLFAPVLAPHRILLMSPALAILIAQGLWNFPGVLRGVLVAVILVYSVVTVDDYYPKESWDRVAASFAPYVQDDGQEMALLEIYRADSMMVYYLDQAELRDFPTESLRLWREFRPNEYPAGLLEQLRAHETVWFTHWSPDQSGFDFLAETGHVQTARFITDHWGNLIQVYRYDSPALLSEQPTRAFTSGMALVRAEYSPRTGIAHLWWSADDSAPLPLAADYSVSAFLLDAAGQLVAQDDNFPQRGQRPTTGWQPGEIIYDPHPLPTATLPPGDYTLAVQVYTYTNGARYPLVTGEDYAVIGTVQVEE